MAKQSPGSIRGEDPQLAALSQSQIYLDYQRAFSGATGLPLDLHAPQMIRLVRYPKHRENPFCLLMAKKKMACAACYALQQELEQGAQFEAKTLRCFAGLCESAVPIRVGEKSIAFLHTGQVLLEHPTHRSLNGIAKRLLEWGVGVDLKALEETYFQSRVLSPAQYESMLRLLVVFSEHLAMCYHGLLTRTGPEEPASVAKARVLIANHYADKLPLLRVARAVGVSATHFSELFRKATSMTFIDYIARVRVEKAKSLLANPNLRVGMIALEVGFRSLSQFNRTFKRITGRSPTALRAG